VVGHLGGGIFVLLLPETSVGDATPLVDRLVELLCAQGVAYRGRVADVRELGSSADAVLEKVLS
jgi:GGDEF domain-containing protein